MTRKLNTITLGELLAHDSQEVQRHARGCLSALKKDISKLVANQDARQDARMTPTPTPKQRLEYLRQELRAERISFGELAELQSLIPYIEAGDVELLEASGVPEFEEEEIIGINKCSHKETTKTPHGQYCLDCHAYL